MGRRPTPRRPTRVPSDFATAIFCLLMLTLLGISVFFGMVKVEQFEAEKHTAPSPKVTHDSLAPTYTYDGEVIRWYVLVDPDTDVQYLVTTGEGAERGSGTMALRWGCAMSDDGAPGVAMEVALLVGMLITADLAVRMLLWMLSAAMVLVQG
jgi:hypothetical protein